MSRKSKVLISLFIGGLTVVALGIYGVSAVTHRIGKEDAPIAAQDFLWYFISVRLSWLGVITLAATFVWWTVSELLIQRRKSRRVAS